MTYPNFDTRYQSIGEYRGPLHIHELLQKSSKLQNNSPKNREWLVRNSALAYKICCLVPSLIFRSPPEFYKEGEKEPDEKAQRKWIENNGSNLWVEVLKKDRIHGFCVFKEMKVNSNISYYTGDISEYKVYSIPEIKKIHRNEDGDIIKYKFQVEFDNNELQGNTVKKEFELDAREVSHVYSEPTLNHLGVSLLSKSWSHIIYAETMLYMLILYDTYLANPILIFPVSSTANDTDRDEIAKNIGPVPLRQLLMVKENETGEYNPPHYLQVESRTDFEKHLDTALKFIAMDADMPKSFLVGDEAGALAAAAQDGLAIQDYLESVFNKYLKYIQYWCVKNNICSEKHKILPKIELRMSDKEKQELENLRLQRVQNLQLFTKINEIRESYDFDKLEDEIGETIPNLGVIQSIAKLQQLEQGFEPPQNINSFEPKNNLRDEITNDRNQEEDQEEANE